jgi:hypothetical protein
MNKQEQVSHIKEILSDIHAMDYDHITQDGLLQSAINYNNEFNYTLTHAELSEIVTIVISE